jgi:hypothetical protein
MKHELKITISYEEEGIDTDCDQFTPITCGSVLVTHDDVPIGCIQHIKLEADAREHFPQLEISFPDFSDLNLWNAPADYLSRFWGSDIKRSIEVLSKFHNVKITYDNPKPKKIVHELEEVGTDGVIDHIAVKLP